MKKLLAILLLIPFLALAQVPAVNSGTAVYPTSGNISVVMTATTPSIGGAALLAGVCATGTVAVPGSTTGMTVTVSPNTYPGDGSLFYGYVSANGTVTVKVCGIVALTPTAGTYNIRVVQ
jgi:hypothetical protein